VAADPAHLRNPLTPAAGMLPAVRHPLAVLRLNDCWAVRLSTAKATDLALALGKLAAATFQSLSFSKPAQLPQDQQADLQGAMDLMDQQAGLQGAMDLMDQQADLQAVMDLMGDVAAAMFDSSGTSPLCVCSLAAVQQSADAFGCLTTAAGIMRVAAAAIDRQCGGGLATLNLAPLHSIYNTGQFREMIQVAAADVHAARQGCSSRGRAVSSLAGHAANKLCHIAPPEVGQASPAPSSTCLLPCGCTRAWCLH